MKSKKIIAGLLALTFVFGGVVLPSGVVSNSLVASATEFSEYQDVMDTLFLDDYCCLRLKDGTLEIENYIGEDKDIEIPSVLDGKTVTRIGSSAFQTRDVDSVVIPDSVTRIEDNAFNSCKLKSVTIPNSVEYIGASSFSNCKSLENIEIPGSVKALGRYAFDRCYSLESVTLNDGLSVIGFSAFYYCENLKSIEIPSSVEKIDDFAFYGCTSLKSLKLNSGLRYIGEYAFVSCDFPQIEIPDSVEEIGKYAFELNKSLKSVILPKELKTFGYYVFCNCSNLESVNIPDDLTFIPDGTFHECVNLKRIIIPASVTTIGDNAFTYFDSEKMAYLPIPNLTISCYSGSYAEKYAKENGLKYQLIKPKPTYPTNIKVEYNQIYHQVRLTWDKVEDADRYGIALYLAGKWRIQKQDITTTSYTTPKNMTPGTSYKLAIAARVDGEWDTANAIKHAVTIYIPNDTDSDEDGIEDFYEKEENVSSYTIAPIIDSWIDDSESISGNNPKIPDLENSGMNMRGSTTPVSPEDNNGPRKNEIIAIRKRKSGSTDAQFSLTPSKNGDFAFTITGTKETKFGEGYTTDDYESTVKVFYEKGVILTEEEQVEPVEIRPSDDGTAITYVFALEQDTDYKIYVNNPTNDHKGEYEIHISEDNWVYAPNGGIKKASEELVTWQNDGYTLQEWFIPSNIMYELMVNQHYMKMKEDAKKEPDGKTEKERLEIAYRDLSGNYRTFMEDGKPHLISTIDDHNYDETILQALQSLDNATDIDLSTLDSPNDAMTVMGYVLTATDALGISSISFIPTIATIPINIYNYKVESKKEELKDALIDGNLSISVKYEYHKSTTHSNLSFNCWDGNNMINKYAINHRYIQEQTYPGGPTYDHDTGFIEQIRCEVKPFNTYADLVKQPLEEQ